jgi:hypothetical protein
MQRHEPPEGCESDSAPDGHLQRRSLGHHSTRQTSLLPQNVGCLHRSHLYRIRFHLVLLEGQKLGQNCRSSFFRVEHSQS